MATGPHWRLGCCAALAIAFASFACARAGGHSHRQPRRQPQRRGLRRHDRPECRHSAERVDGERRIDRDPVWHRRVPLDRPCRAAAGRGQLVRRRPQRRGGDRDPDDRCLLGSGGDRRKRREGDAHRPARRLQVSERQCRGRRPDARHRGRRSRLDHRWAGLAHRARRSDFAHVSRRDREGAARDPHDRGDDHRTAHRGNLQRRLRRQHLPDPRRRRRPGRAGLRRHGRALGRSADAVLPKPRHRRSSAPGHASGDRPARQRQERPELLRLDALSGRDLGRHHEDDHHRALFPEGLERAVQPAQVG